MHSSKLLKSTLLLQVALFLTLSAMTSLIVPGGMALAESGNSTHEDHRLHNSFEPLQAIVKVRSHADLSDIPSITRTESLPFGYVLVHFEDVHDPGVDMKTLPEDERRILREQRILATELEIDQLRAHPDIDSVQPNRLYRSPEFGYKADSVETNAASSDSDPGSNPSGTDGQRGSGNWFDSEINLGAAQSLETGSQMTRIAILDYGRSYYSTHPDLLNTWVPNVEYDAGRQDGDARNPSSHHHGIAVAGVASRVCPDCKLLNVKLTTNVSGTSISDASVSRGIHWAVNNGARVINMSFESTAEQPCSSILSASLQHAENNDVVMIAAAGNTSTAAQKSPANCPTVLSVAATQQNQILASYSNRNGGAVNHVDLAAPGGASPHFQSGIGCSFGTSGQSGIIVPWSSGQSHCSRYMSGTSFAAPHASGVAGLILARNPNLSASQVRSILRNTTQTVACSSGSLCGTGLLDAYAAVQLARPLPGAGDSSPTAQAYANCNRLNCTFNGTSSSDDQGIASYEWLLPDQTVKSGAWTSHFVPGYGYHTYRLRVTDTTGQSHEVLRSVYVSPSTVQPVAGVFENPNRPGNRLHFFRNSSNYWTAYWSTFDNDGDSVWYMSDQDQVSSGQWSAPLYRVTSSSGGVNLTQVGSLELDFSNSSSTWLSWSLNGKSGGERYTRTGGGQSRSGHWYAPWGPDNGVGMIIQDYGSTWDTTLLAYNNITGYPVWVYADDVPVSGSSASTNLYSYSGTGLCPECGGSDPATPLTASQDYSGYVDLTLYSSGSGSNGDIELYRPGPVGPILLLSMQEQLARLTAP